MGAPAGARRPSLLSGECMSYSDYRNMSNSESIDKINAAARKEGLSYGQFVAKYKLYSDFSTFRTAAQRERDELKKSKNK